MAVKATCLVGLDVHARQTHAAVLDLRSGELAVRRVVGAPEQVVPVLGERGGPGGRCMRPGRPGSGWRGRRGLAGSTCGSSRRGRSRRGRATGSRPTAVTRSAWCGCWPPGELRFAFVPSIEDEAFRDLIRCIEDVRGDLMRARHRLSKFLLRRGHRYIEAQAWSAEAHALAARAELR